MTIYSISLCDGTSDHIELQGSNLADAMRDLDNRDWVVTLTHAAIRTKAIISVKHV